MAKAKDQTREGVAAKPADFGRASDAAPETTGLPLHPLMAHPAAALAAMTAVGFGFATQMASAFLGSLQGALEATETLARKIEDEKVRDDRPAPPSESVATSVTRKPAAKVKRTAKVPVAKAAPAKSVKATPVVAAPVASKAATPKPAKAVPRGRGKADDLKKISGVGPKLEQVLNGIGVTRFADIAGWSDEDVARIDAEIGLGGRIARDGWVAQAKALKEGGA
ncbi:5' DNA nuclease [Ciceribacter ferrooxidans]|uniref:5' DNA nuclease n=1 Tax=Ciceribacter ferrooxidans TaxID=2509717 RepID=A0A4Q2TJ14_9HYPH|nr:5' DNA nuclease [Ciceribacter ferrooxidans]RYC17641.1 5' DNA nuclease [Ciceribacter ferrooxidans]